MIRISVHHQRKKMYTAVAHKDLPDLITFSHPGETVLWFDGAPLICVLSGTKMASCGQLKAHRYGSCL